jgi:hypothetical protein
VYTYFGCDRNVTATHFDGYENLLVCLSGTKRLWLYPPSDARYLYAGAGAKGDASRAAAPPFQTFEQLPAELRASFGDVAHARPLEVHLGPGDCLYLPACWWHCVEGSRERNMILNWWFDVHEKKRNHEGELPSLDHRNHEEGELPSLDNRNHEGELPSLVNGLERERAFLDDGPVLAALCAPPAPA